MASLKEIRIRIASVTSTRQITSAMKMVSAAKLRKAQDVITQLRPYSRKLNEIVANLCQNLHKPEDGIYIQSNPSGRVLIIVITSNKGLCGAFNTNINKRVIGLLTEDYENHNRQNMVDIITIGKKGYEFLKARGARIVDNQSQLFEGLSYENVAPFAEDIMAQFVSGKYGQIILVYNQFKNAATQQVMCETFLPVSLTAPVGESAGPALDYIFEPNRGQIVTDLIPKTLRIQFYKALLDSSAAEHGARMTAMHKATDNATELLKELKINYNKARQSSITNEILEIVAGANAISK